MTAKGKFITSKKIVQWLIDHPAINRSEVARITGYARNNLEKALAGKRCIPEKYLPIFEKTLSDYGYN